MDKLLHERLREFATSDYAIDLIALVHAKGASMVHIAEAIADEIEKYYIPRPRFEDGEPVQFGDEVEGCDGLTECLLLFEDGSGTIYGVNDDVWGDNSANIGADISGIDRFVVKRPTKVLDADGVEINVGDTVYNLENDGERGTVRCFYSYGVGVEWDGGWRSDGVNPQYLTHEKPVFDAEGVRICKGDTVWHLYTGHKAVVTTVYRDDETHVEVNMTGQLIDYAPSALTHREPDSLEKLRDYVREQEEQEFSGARDVYHKIGDRLTAIIDRDKQ